MKNKRQVRAQPHPSKNAESRNFNQSFNLMAGKRANFIVGSLRSADAFPTGNGSALRRLHCGFKSVNELQRDCFYKKKMIHVLVLELMFTSKPLSR